MEYPDSIWEVRRKAPFHFHAKADNARMSAYVLCHVSDELVTSFACDARYGGNIAFPLVEGFRREAAISLGLILKALICLQRKKAPPANHDVYQLWSDAKLPQLDHDDRHRLAELTEILYWRGRYGAPKDDKDLIKAHQRFEKHQRMQKIGSLKVQKHIPLGWIEFDNLYQTVNKRFWELEPNDPRNHVA